CAEFWIRSQKLRCASVNCSWLSKISENPRIDVSGVRNSWARWAIGAERHSAKSRSFRFSSLSCEYSCSREWLPPRFFFAFVGTTADVLTRPTITIDAKPAARFNPCRLRSHSLLNFRRQRRPPHAPLPEARH